MQHTAKPQDGFAFPESTAGIGLQVDGSTFHGSDIHIGNHNVSIGTVHGNVQLSNVPSVHPESTRIPLANWISSLDFSQHQAEAFERRTEGTFRWLLDSPQITDWKTEESGGILLCVGKPGAGKTTFASLVIHSLLQQANTDPRAVAAVCYIFCRYHTTFTILQLFELILKQLILQCPSAKIDSLQKMKDKGLRPSLNEIVSILQANFDQTSNIFIVIDAVDECFTEEVRHRLLDILRSMTSVKILLTSRPIPSIESALHGIVILTVCPNTFDISIHIRTRALHKPNLAKLIAKVSWDDLEAKIVLQADGIFLLAELHISSLSEQTNLNAFLGALEALPKEASATYARALERITRQPENVQQLAFYALSWVFHAFRPLTVIELQHGVAISRLSRIANEDDLDDEASIISACAGLLIVNQETKSVSFIHYTVQEYIAQVSSDLLPKVEVTKSCLRVVSIPGVQYHPPTHPLIEYAAAFWTLFIRQHEDDAAIVDTALIHLSSPACVALLETALYHSNTGIANERCDGNALHLVAEAGLTRLTTILLEKHQLDVNHRDTHGCTPLSLAAYNGHLEIIQMLLEWNVDVDASYFGHTRTALLLAAERGHYDIVRALIATNKVDLNAKDAFGQTTLYWVAGSGSSELVKLLLGCEDVDVDAITDSGSSPLLFASAQGHTEVVKLLLDTRKVQVDRKDKTGRTPLSLAAQYGHSDVVKLFFDNADVDVNSTDLEYGSTPLLWAAMVGQLDMVKLLHATANVNVCAQNKFGESVFAVAANNGCLAVIEWMLANGEKDDIDRRDAFGRTPLAIALRHGNTAVVKCLLGTQKVDRNAKDDDDRTPLWYAAFSGQVEAVELLLGDGEENIDCADRYGHTPLAIAAMHGHSAVVAHLLGTNKVNWNAKDILDGSPLWLAAQNGHLEVLKLLMENGENIIDCPDKAGLTPLAVAAANGHSTIVEYLLGTGKVWSATDNDGRSPFWWAASGGNLEVLNFLMTHGEHNINGGDKHGCTPLAIAIQRGHSAVIETLLGRKEVDIGAKDNDNRTPLWWAAFSGQVEVVERLLGNGEEDINREDGYSRAPLAAAAYKGNVAAVKALLETQKVDTGAKGIDGTTALWWAAFGGHLEVVKALLEHGQSEIDQPDVNGHTPLAVAAMYGHSAVVAHLLGTDKVNRNAKDNLDGSPLWLAAANGHLEVLKLLMENGENTIDCPDKAGLTPLVAAAAGGHFTVVEYLFGTGKVNRTAIDNDGRSPLWWAASGGNLEALKLLMVHGEHNVNGKDKHGCTPLAIAIQRGHSAVVEALLGRQEVDMDTKDLEARTPFWWAAFGGHLHVMNLLVKTAKVDINNKDSRLQTPLICAATRGHLHVVQFLLERPTIDVHASDSEGWTAVLYAADSGHINVLELLLHDSRITDNLHLHKLRLIKPSSFVTPLLIPSPSPVPFDSKSSSPMSLVSDALATHFQERVPNPLPSPSETDSVDTQLTVDPPKPSRIATGTSTRLQSLVNSRLVFSLIAITSSFALLLALVLQNT